MATELARVFMARHPAEVARVLAASERPALAAFAATVPVPILAPLLPLLPADVAAACVAGLDEAAAAGLLAELRGWDAALLLANLDPARRRVLAARLPARLAPFVELRNRFPAGTVGTLMEPAVATLPARIEIGRAREILRESASRVLPVVYLLDERRRPAAVLRLADLACAASGDGLYEYTRAPAPPLHARAMLAAVQDDPGWAQLDFLAVVDADGSFLGVLSRLDLYRWQEARAEPRAGPSELAATLIILAELMWTPGARLLADAASAPPERKTDD